jgi:hypothetical protein
MIDSEEDRDSEGDGDVNMKGCKFCVLSLGTEYQDFDFSSVSFFVYAICLCFLQLILSYH